jgi:hypothetical protein
MLTAVVTLRTVVDLEWEPDLQEDLYHYTDFAALQSIYEKGEIWATNAQYLNDISEMQLGPRAILGSSLRLLLPDMEVASQLKKDTEEFQAIQSAMDKDEFKKAMNDEDSDAAAKFRRLAESIHEMAESQRRFDPRSRLFTEIREACKVALEDTNCFIFSTSKQPDQLSQWRAYARDGVCIEFSASALCNSLELTPASRAKMKSVIYYDGKTILPETFGNPIISWANERRSQLIADGLDQDGRTTKIAEEMMTQVALVKDFHFEEEGEVRIAVQGNPNHFTTPSRYGIVPRMKVPITPDAIRSVIVGPAAHTELRVQSLRTYFENVGFKNDPSNRGQIEVKPSAVPYRDW